MAEDIPTRTRASRGRLFLPVLWTVLGAYGIAAAALCAGIWRPA
jgi:hypothetical protein